MDEVSTSLTTIQEINPFFGQIGHLFVIISFVAALLATLSYLFSKTAADPDKHNWLKTARILFFTHAAAVAGIIITLFIMIFNHHFEYHYVWSHSSLDLQSKYILSCFWEGQEGSFLLWCFWHVVLGCILIFTAGKWEAPVLFVFALIQTFLTSFLLGFQFGDFHIGSSPFLLLEDALTQDPVFLFSDYMKYIQDGTGLNALLQNYWMVIHPPVLFLGFASCSVPFAFAIAGLWKKEYTAWIKPALAWGLFAAGILGVGVLMGGAWAYEALSFGGFWAWDPVENASIMPWLVLVGALHTMVIAKSTGHALKSAFVLIILTFILVLYASFLTRSGILGDTSVHSFVTSGLMGHLLLFMGTFIVLSIYFFQANAKFIPVHKKEEANSSREFWMFIGSLVLLFSCLHIVFFTSIPVYNHIFEGINNIIGTNIRSNYAPPTDAVHYYTSVQIWVGIAIALLFAGAQFLKYKKTNAGKFFKQITAAIVISIVLAIVTSLQLDYPIFHAFTLLLFAAYFAILANVQYIFTGLKGRLKVAGASVAHAGFGVLLIGILISNANQQVISRNTLGIDYGEGFDEKFKRENILLYKNMPVTMGGYIVTYKGDSTADRETLFKVHYEKINEETGESDYNFTLYPYLLLDKKSQQLTPNPDTKHYPDHDVFTHISSIPNTQANEPDVKTTEHIISVGDTIFFSKGILILQKINRYSSNDSISAGALLTAKIAGTETIVEPKLHIVNNQLISEPVALEEGSLVLNFQNILPEKDQFVISTTEEQTKDDWIIMKAILFPMINLVWLGSILMATGFFMSMVRRIRENKNTSSAT
ncbi:MAG: cytochrome c biogenesis protein CcsA [Chitinophagales bacterium]|nr:cytochrome c biogenesis protein CcsA [Chitinophagales bacterium]